MFCANITSNYADMDIITLLMLSGLSCSVLPKTIYQSTAYKLIYPRKS